MHSKFDTHLKTVLTEIRDAGLYKVERPITSSQAGRIDVLHDGVTHEKVINLCANNYLGLANDPRLIDAARNSLSDDGYGMASVRFICGTKDGHRALEQRLAQYLGYDDAILYAACFDANGGVFEPLLGPEDAIVSDALNHASIIDGIRLCKAKRYRYANSDMDDLEVRLREARSDGARFVMIATDGVFSMDGTIARLSDICALAQKYDALVMVDDCHATGFIGPKGAGTPSLFDVRDQVDLVSGTLGKALGGAIGGYIASSQAIIDLLRQRSRPYLFSNSLPPMVVAAGLAAIDIAEQGDDLRLTLKENTDYWRKEVQALGFEVLPGEHPIVPIMLGDAKLSQEMARGLFDEGVYVTGFFYPVVPKGQARIRTQMSAGLTKDDLNFALQAFEKVGKKTGALS